MGAHYALPCDRQTAARGFMKKVPRTVEVQTRAVEGFDVTFLPLEGAPKRVEDYPFPRPARGDWTVSMWRDRRFRSPYPGFVVEVLWPDGSPVSGRSLLSTVRLTYLQAGPSSAAKRH
jgi:hypothetical protein